MSAATTFAIVIPTYNEESNIGRLLESIRRQTAANYSIAIVDQSSTDRTADIARSYGSTVINIPKPHFYSPPARSRNIGARSVEGKIILHLDADMELGSADFLQKLAALIDGEHRAAIISEYDVAFGFWAKCKALERSCYRGSEMEAARAVTRDLFLTVGGYDEEISSGEDFFTTRLYERHTRLARDESLALRHHVGRWSLGSMLRKKFDYGRTAGVYLVKARRIGAKSSRSIVRSSLRAYARNWRLVTKEPAHYLGIFPLRALEFAAMQWGMRSGLRGTAEASQLDAKPTSQKNL